VRHGNKLFGKHFKNLRVDPAKLLAFVLKYGETNTKCDGLSSTNLAQWRRVTFGCAGQAYTKLTDGTSAPKSTYGFDVFDKIEDEGERLSIKQMLADILDAMQDCKDEIKVIHLHNNKPFHC
jgi:hypothetical protein